MTSKINNNECKTFLDLTNSEDYKKYLDLTNSKEYIELYNYYQKATFMDVLGVSRQENPHSSFWRWLLDNSSNHEMGDFPLRKFIEMVCFAYVKLYGSISEKDATWFQDEKNLFNKENKENKEVLARIKEKNYKIKMVKIDCEITLDNQRRADIFAEVILEIEEKTYKLYIVIENKVSSSEHDSQTQKYAADMYKKYKKNDQENPLFMFCYLSPKTNKELETFPDDKANGQLNNHCLSKEFVCINYQYLVDWVLEPSLFQVKDTYAKYLLKDYLRCLGKAILENDIDNKNAINNRNFLVMAVGKDEKSLVKALWRTHQEILTKKFHEIANADKEKTYPDKEFYCSIVSTLLISWQFREEDEKDKRTVALLNKVKKSIDASTKKNFFIYEDEQFGSNQRGEHSIGFLAHKLIKKYLQKPGHNVPDALRKLKDTGIKNNSWLKEIIIRKDKVEKLVSDPTYNSGNDKSFETNSKEAFINNYYNLPVEGNGKKIINEDEDEDYYAIEAYDENGEKIKVYTARFFGGSDIEKITKAFGIDTVTKIQ